MAETCLSVQLEIRSRPDHRSYEAVCRVGGKRYRAKGRTMQEALGHLLELLGGTPAPVAEA